MENSIKERAAEMRRAYVRERYAARRDREKEAQVSTEAPVDELTAAYRAYRRRAYAKNPEAQRIRQERYWEKKAAEAMKAEGERL